MTPFSVPSEDAAPENGRSISYQGQLLIAMPSLNAPPFNRSVVYLCQHDADHAMGLILNQRIRGLNLARILKDMDLKPQVDEARDMPVYNGGPVQSDRGFVLHSLDYSVDDVTIDLIGPPIQTRGGTHGLGLTNSRDILIDLAGGSGPAFSLIALGYAGWGPGQLESEISRNDWLLAPATQDLIFAEDPAQVWNAAVASLGIEPWHLSGAGGTA